MGVLTGSKPRRDVLEGDLEDAIFGADFGDLIVEDARTPNVYADPRTFFENTHHAQDLKTIVQAVFRRLAKAEEGGATIRLSTDLSPVPVLECRDWDCLISIPCSTTT
ncbi:MAG TPA: hypothetical protein VGA37_07370 [Gemmatimonadales bacterium]